MTVAAAPARIAPLHPGDARQRILEAALGCFVTSGFHSTSMHQICAAAQMSPGGVYRHFASKDEIIIAIAGHVHARNSELIGRLAREGVTLDAFREAGFQCMRELMSGPECALFSEVFAEGTRNPKMRAAFEKTYHDSRLLLRDVLAKLQDKGEIEPTLDIDAVASMIVAIGDGLLMRSRLDPAMNFEAMWPALSALIHRMLIPASKLQVSP